MNGFNKICDISVSFFFSFLFTYVYKFCATSMELIFDTQYDFSVWIAFALFRTRSISVDATYGDANELNLWPGVIWSALTHTHMHATTGTNITVVWPIMRWAEQKNTSKSLDVRVRPNSFRPHSAARSKYTIWHGALNRYHHLRKFDCCIDD